MKLFTKSFECRTDLSLEQCKAKILDNFPKQGIVASSNILLRSLSEESDAVAFSLMQSKIRGFYVIMDAVIKSQDNKVRVTGDVRVSNAAVQLITYFLIISFILIFVFRPIVWLSLYFLLMFCMIAFFGVNTLRNRNQLINTVCVVLSE